jgi:GT2 family glycosyltransferase
MDVSIIINNYKTRGLLKQCLKGIFSNPPSLNFEVVVIDNNSEDGSNELVREMFALPDGAESKQELSENGVTGTIEELSKNVRLIVARANLGHHKGNNLGIKYSTGKYVLILNTDILFFDNAVEKMYRFMEENPKVALAGPKLKNPDGSIQMSCMRFPKLLTPFYRRTFLGRFKFAQAEVDQYLMHDFDHNSTIGVDWILGACEIVRREAIDKVGRMDEDLFLYFGDVAWCKNFWLNGYSVYYFNDCNIIHYHKRESAEGGIFSRTFRIHAKDWLKYLIKYYR